MTAFKRAGILLAIAMGCAARVAHAQDSTAARVAHHEPNKYGIVVSATRTEQEANNVPNGVAVVQGADLRRRGARTLADALQDVLGLDTGDGSDNGSRLPNIGMWGLKEFDALLITLDGVPVGGPFNPSLSQIPVEDIDRIEVVKGPQGTLYGVSAFAGMIQVFSRRDEDGIGHVAVGGGSFGEHNASAGLAHDFGPGTKVRLTGSFLRGDGWQDRTESSVDRGSVSVTQRVGAGSASLLFSNYHDNQHWGTPLKFSELQAPEDVLSAEKNYAVLGARIEHRVSSGTARLAYPLTSKLTLENTVSVTRDDQYSLTSFPGDLSAAEDSLYSSGVKLHPRETSAYEDLRLISHFQAGGAHELVTGAAVTWGRTTAVGIGFDIAEYLPDYPNGIASLDQTPVGDNRAFEDRRTFMGVYAHDTWSPSTRVTLAAGGRYDNANEKLHAQGQEVGGSLDVADDARTDGAFSGDASLLVRLAEGRHDWLEESNAYVNVKHSFKPAAPNLTEAEDAKILEPERTQSVEAGLKSRGFDGQLGVNVSGFSLTFTNLVVSTLDASNNPELINAGKERFNGAEVEFQLTPKAAPGLSVSAGLAYHDAKFVNFTFVTPDGDVEDDSGNRLELTPQQLFNLRASYVSPVGLGGFAALRYQGTRPVDRDNAVFVDAFSEYDAGLFFEKGKLRLSATGRNLGDDRHVAAESDIGDLEFYIAPPRRFTAEASVGF